MLIRGTSISDAESVTQKLDVKIRYVRFTLMNIATNRRQMRHTMVGRRQTNVHICAPYTQHGTFTTE